MGLDSVELVMEVEKFFSFLIPDSEAEQIESVSDMVECVARHKAVTNEKQDLKNRVMAEFRKYLQIENDTCVFYHHDISNQEFWKSLESKTNLKIPKPRRRENRDSGLLHKMAGWLTWPVPYDWNQITFERMCEVICFANYETLVKADQLQSKYEIYVAVAGITEDKIGIDCYEISPEKKFTSDFGID